MHKDCARATIGYGPETAYGETPIYVTGTVEAKNIDIGVKAGILA